MKTKPTIYAGTISSKIPAGVLSKYSILEEFKVYGIGILGLAEKKAWRKFLFLYLLTNSKDLWTENVTILKYKRPLSLFFKIVDVRVPRKDSLDYVDKYNIPSVCEGSGMDKIKTRVHILLLPDCCFKEETTDWFIFLIGGSF